MTFLKVKLMVEIEELTKGDIIQYNKLCTDRKLNVSNYEVGSLFEVKLIYPYNEDDCLLCVEVLDETGKELDFYGSLSYCKVTEEPFTVQKLPTKQFEIRLEIGKTSVVDVGDEVKDKYGWIARCITSFLREISLEDYVTVKELGNGDPV